jgi:hypothetical protein
MIGLAEFEGSKHFFFEKKKQKTFGYWASLARGVRDE